MQKVSLQFSDVVASVYLAISPATFSVLFSIVERVGESNSRYQFGKLNNDHYTTPA